MIGKLNERASVYYCGDDFSSLSGVDHDAVNMMEMELVEKVDLILVASETLAQKFPAHKTVMIPHGVDAQQFQQPCLRPIDLPTGKPIAGFYGSLSEWIDVELLTQTATDLPDWDFVFIGPQQTDLSSLKKLPNTYFLDQKKHSELPAYAQHWQVSMLPFKDNAQIRSSNPLKLREYLAVGKPIVSTDFPALDSYRDVVNVAHSQNSFAEKIRLSALDTADENIKSVLDVESWFDLGQLSGGSGERQRRIIDESWEVRSQAVDELLDIL